MLYIYYYLSIKNLFIAASYGHFKCVKLLVETYNTPVGLRALYDNKEESWNFSAIDAAQEHGHANIAEYLALKQ